MKNFNLIKTDKIIHKDEHFFIIEDRYPVSKGHLLIISNRIIDNYFSLSNKEKTSLIYTIEIAKTIIETKHKPDGYNIGMNCGKVAGQTIFHFHCHIIPRYEGDLKSPEGGVRGVIPSKMKY